MSNALSTHLATQLDATIARRSFEEILQDVPSRARGVQPDGLPEAYSLWQILEHMRRCQADYFRFCTDSEYSPPTWPDDYWPDAVAPPSDDAWVQSVNEFQRELREIIAFVNDSSNDLTAEIPHAEALKSRDGYVDRVHGATYADEIAKIADHNAYHLGQFVTVRRLLDAWPAEEIGTQGWEEAV